MPVLGRLIDFTKGLIALAATLALLLGVPAALTGIIGWPLPTVTPSWELIRRHVTDADIPDVFIINTLAVIVWLAWAQLAVDIIVEFTAALRGRLAKRAPVMPGIQLFAARLATWATLMITSPGPARPALAAPLQAFNVEPVAAQVVELDDTMAIIERLTPTHLTATANGTITDTEAANGVYITGPGDSWWDISERLLGNGMRWNEIRTLNLGLPTASGVVIDDEIETIRPGWQLLVPPDAAADLLTTAEQHPTWTAPPDPSTDRPEDEIDGELVTAVPGDHFWSGPREQVLPSGLQLDRPDRMVLSR